MRKFKLLLFIIIFSVSSLYATYPKVALVLSGGGAKGFAHVSVVEEIKKLGIPIDFICGTSMGGIIGAYYAIGYSSNDIKNMIKKEPLINYLLDQSSRDYSTPPSLFNDNNGIKFSFGIDRNGIGDNPGLLSDQSILSYLNKTTIKSPGEIDFDNLEIPYKAMAINVETGEGKIIDHGYISDAMRATMSLPIVFPPYVLKDGTYCMDGGVFDNLPVFLAKDWGADIIISVDVSSDSLKDSEGFSSLSGAVIQTSNLVTFSNRKESQNNSDIVIKPDVSDFLILDVGKFDQILEKGYEAFEEKKDELIDIRDKISKHRELEFDDESESSHYSNVLNPLITSIKYEKIRFDKSYLFTSIFDKYLNKRLEENLLNDLENDIKSFAKLNNISSVSFNFNPTNRKENSGVLEIGLRDWNKSPSSIDLIGLTKIGFSNHINNRAWFYLSFNLDTQLKKMVAKKISIDLRLNISEAININSKIGYQFIDKNDYELIQFFQFSTSVGSLSPANNTYVKYYIPSFSIGFSVGTGFDLTLSNKLSLELLANYNLVSFSDTTLPDGITPNEAISYENSLLNYINLGLSFSYLNSEASIFSNKGYGIEGIGSMHISNSDINPFVYIKSKYDIPITKKSCIKLGLKFGFSTTNYELSSSYFDLGGYSEIPGYYFGWYTREYLIADLMYQRKLSDNIVPIFVQVGIKGFGFDKYNPIENIYPTNSSFIIESPNSKIPNITNYGIGVYSGIGLKTNFGDIVFGTGYSLNGNFNLVLEFV